MRALPAVPVGKCHLKSRPARRNYAVLGHMAPMKTANAVPAAVFLAAGLFAVVVAIPVTFSGVGGFPFTDSACCFAHVIAPKGTIVVLHYGTVVLFFEPAFFVGIGLLVLGVYLLRKGITTLGFRGSTRIPSRPDLHR